jgi:AraC-like DNA-binding protein
MHPQVHLHLCCYTFLQHSLSPTGGLSPVRTEPLVNSDPSLVTRCDFLVGFPRWLTAEVASTVSRQWLCVRCRRRRVRRYGPRRQLFAFSLLSLRFPAEGEGMRFTDPDRARMWIEAHYTPHAVTITGSRADFHFEHRVREQGSFAIAHIAHSMALEMDVSPYEHLVVSQLINGRFRVQHRKDTLEPTVGQTYLYPAGAAARVSWEGVELGLVRLDRHAVAAHVAGVGAQIVLVDTFPVSAARTRGWQSLVRHVSREMLPQGTMHSPLVRSAAFALLATTFTQVFPCRIPALSHSPAVSRPSAVVRRAVEFIASHAGEPIDIAQIAQAARVGPRGLQVAFRRHLDITPMEYLRRVRLDCAHRELIAADPSDTVKRIAARWGYSQVQRFTELYTVRYGRPPGVTLRS